MKFTDKGVLERIYKIANNVSKNYYNKFDADELVQEAWIRHKPDKEYTISLLCLSAHRDMIDYIRSVLGRKQYSTKQNKWLQKPAECTNFNSGITGDSDSEHRDSIFDGEFYHDYNFLENSEIVNLILVNMPEMYSRAIKEYYMEGKGIAEMSEKEGCGKSNISLRLKRGRKMAFQIAESYNISL